jgi:hypothetical protein
VEKHVLAKDSYSAFSHCAGAHGVLTSVVSAPGCSMRVVLDGPGSGSQRQQETAAAAPGAQPSMQRDRHAGGQQAMSGSTSNMLGTRSAAFTVSTMVNSRALRPGISVQQMAEQQQELDAQLSDARADVLLLLLEALQPDGSLPPLPELAMCGRLAALTHAAKLKGDMTTQQRASLLGGQRFQQNPWVLRAQQVRRLTDWQLLGNGAACSSALSAQVLAAVTLPLATLLSKPSLLL